MLISHATQPSPDVAVNEDLVVAGPHFAIVLDGATQLEGVETGCVHDVPWLVARLGGRLAYLLLTDPGDLRDLLANAIGEVAAEHSDSCDLGNPDSPSTTVSIVRERDTTVDYLVLADSPIVLRDVDGAAEVIVDDRLDFLPGYDLGTVREHRNTPGGFWVASTMPAAASQALNGSLDTDTLECAGLFSDGASRLAERHGMTWVALVELLERAGPAAVIARVRDADRRAAGQLPGKFNDDATAVLCRWSRREEFAD
ncbi:MAG: protein phosphatase 2C domain-containing protein [Nocardioidaceae bacterium]